MTFIAWRKDHYKGQVCDMGGQGSGRKPKPVERKERLGNPSKRALPKNIIVLPSVEPDKVPEAQRPLGKYGTELWERMWLSGATWLKPTVDSELMLICCELIDERMLMRGRVATDPSAWRDRRGLRELDRLITSLLGDLGFSPTERGNISSEGTAAGGFAELNKRIAQKRARS
jgi:uncharacterized protein YjiS (DUF1127 family)